MAEQGVIAELLVKIGADISGLSTGLDKANRSISGASGSLTKAGAALSVGVTAPMTMAGKNIADVATDFDREMRNIQSISKENDASLAALGQRFLDMSTDINQTTDSAPNLAAGFYQIQSSGFAGANAMTVLAASTKAGSAGLTDTETAAKGILAVLNAYGLSADDAARISDVMFRTVDVGVLTFEDLATNVGDFVATGKAAGVSFDDLAAGMATLTKGGVSPAEAATALNRVMLAFISPSKEASKLAADLGIDLSATGLASKGLAGAMEDLRLKTGGNIESITTLMGDVRGLKGALGLTRDEGKAYASDLDAISKSAGATATAFEIQTKSFDAQGKSISNTMDVLKIGLGNELMPMLLEVAQALLPIIRGFNDLSEPVKKGVVVFGLVATVIGPLLGLLGMMAAGWGLVTGLLGGVVSIAGVVVGAIAAISAPVWLIIGAVTALYIAWKNNWGGIQDITKNAMDGIKNTIAHSSIGKLLAGINSESFLAKWVKEVQDEEAKAAGQVYGPPGPPTAAELYGPPGPPTAGIGDVQGIISGLWNTLLSQIKGALPGVSSGLNAFGIGENTPGYVAPSAADMAAWQAQVSRTDALVRQAQAASNQASQNVTVNIYNPVGTPTEESVTRELSIMSALGILRPVPAEAVRY